jgi:tripeptide aminopeptidase
LEYENFNAAAAEFEIVGASVHPGSAKGKMINASLVAMEINSLLPGAEIPSLTEGYEGFYHLTGVESEVSHGRLSYIVRDHDRDLFEARLKTLRHVERIMNEKYGEGTVTLTLRHQYRNMREMVEPHMHVIHAAEEAIRQAGLTPTVEPIRGGTDGARLSFMGLPCPNLGTGGFAFHGPYEHITAEGMDLATDILLGIVKIYANKTEASE